MNTVIPVMWNGKQGIVKIILLPNGAWNISIDIEGNRMELIQNGKASYPLTGIVHGKLYKVLEERYVGLKRWKVRDFILNVNTNRGEQKRLLQASGEVINDIMKVVHDSPIICETTFLGKEFNRGEEFVYRNLDEVSKIHVI